MFEKYRNMELKPKNFIIIDKIYRMQIKEIMEELKKESLGRLRKMN